MLTVFSPPLICLLQLPPTMLNISGC